MKEIAREKDYGDTVSVVRWCPNCGRILVISKAVCDPPEDPPVEAWGEPISAILSELMDSGIIPPKGAEREELEHMRALMQDIAASGEGDHEMEDR